MLRIQVGKPLGYTVRRSHQGSTHEYWDRDILQLRKVWPFGYHPGRHIIIEVLNRGRDRRAGSKWARPIKLAVSRGLFYFWPTIPKFITTTMMDATGQKRRVGSRRTHQKSRLGCRNCRRRRVKVSRAGWVASIRTPLRRRTCLVNNRLLHGCVLEPLELTTLSVMKRNHHARIVCFTPLSATLPLRWRKLCRPLLPRLPLIRPCQTGDINSDHLNINR